MFIDNMIKTNVHRCCVYLSTGISLVEPVLVNVFLEVFLGTWHLVLFKAHLLEISCRLRFFN
jgi:hypothetical protein